MYKKLLETIRCPRCGTEIQKGYIKPPYSKWQFPEKYTIQCYQCNLYIYKMDKKRAVEDFNSLAHEDQLKKFEAYVDEVNFLYSERKMLYRQISALAMVNKEDRKQ